MSPVVSRHSLSKLRERQVLTPHSDRVTLNV